MEGFLVLVLNLIALLLTIEIDPLTLKSSELKKILKTNKVAFPSDATKSELVAIFWDSASGNKSETVSIKKDLNYGSQKIIRKREKRKKTKPSKIKDNLLIAEDHDTSDEKETNESVVETPEPEVLLPNVKAKEPVQKDLNLSEPSPSTPVKQITTTKKTPQFNKYVEAASSASALKKRRSMLLEVGIPHSNSPSKGNVFEVESDSDTKFLSPKRKRAKVERNLVSSPSASKSSNKKAKAKSTTLNDEVSSKPNTETASDEVEVTDIVEKAGHSPAWAKISPKKKDSEHRDSSISIESPHPVLDNTAEVVGNLSIWSDATKKSPAISRVSHDLSSFDSALSFDKALEKLKKANALNLGREDSPHSHKDEELAKFLGVDIHSVKPKRKAKRSITPRRPIYILKEKFNRLKSSLRSSSILKKKSAPNDNEVDTINILEESLHQSFSESSDGEIHEKGKRRPRKSSDSFFKSFLFLSLWLSVVGALLFFYWYREQTMLVGYCGQEVNKKTIPESDKYPVILSKFGSYLDDNFKPICVDCPQHARCFPSLEIACYNDFVPYAPWYYRYVAFLDPKAQKCIPDSKKAEKIEIMIDTALDLLRARNANQMCGRSPLDDLNAGLSLHDLHDLLLSLKAPYITEEEFEELWARASAELQKEPEIIVRQVNFFQFDHRKLNHTNNKVGFKFSESNTGDDVKHSAQEKNAKDEIFRSTSLSHLSFGCLISNTIVSLIVKFKMAVLVLVCMVLMCFGIYRRYQQSRIYAQKIDTMYKEVLNKLQRQVRVSQQSSELPAYVGSIQLRDLILSSESNLAYKMRLWEGVIRKVDRNTNVRHELLEVHGEVMKVWQWIGSSE